MSKNGHFQLLTGNLDENQLNNGTLRLYRSLHQAMTTYHVTPPSRDRLSDG